MTGEARRALAEIERERDYWKCLAQSLLAREERRLREEEHKEMMAPFYAAIGMRPL